MICSNEQVKGSELHKIKIDWGDGTEDILVKDLSDRGSSLNTVFQSWKRISHLYNSDKKKVYLTEDVKSLSSINIYFYNTYNDVIRLVIPFKLVYKSLYDLNCRFDLVSANTGNDYLTTFVFKEGLGNSLSVVQNINPMLQINYEDNIEYIKKKTVSIDDSDDFIDEDNVKWAWDQIPYVSIKTSCDKYYPNYTSDKSNALTSLRCECFEETVPIENWKPIVERILDHGNVFLSNVSVDKNGAFMFYVFGGNEVSKIEEIKDFIEAKLVF